jgi:hypothetical protein
MTDGWSLIPDMESISVAAVDTDWLKALANLLGISYSITFPWQ